MPLNLKHIKWNSNGRTFEVLDEFGQSTGQLCYKSKVGQKNVDLGAGTFAPYVWDALSQSIRYGNHICTFDAGGFQTIREYGSPETLIDDQRLELQYFREQGKKWRVLALHNASLKVPDEWPEDHCIITRRLDDGELADGGGGNWLEVDFLFRPMEKVRLTFRLHVTNADQYRIRFQNSLKRLVCGI